jgi:hypothetical protein
MLGFARLKAPALFACLACASIVVGTMPSHAAMQSYVNVKGQKQGAIKGSVVTPAPKANVHINVHPVITTVKVK